MKRRTRSTTMVGNFPDWSEFIALLNRHRVKYLVIGAHALAVLGRPRHTGVLDVFVEASEANIARLAAALRDFGFEELADQAHEFMEPNKMAILGHPPVRIDITNTISGISFEEAWQGRTRRKIGGRMVSFIGRRDYIRNKLASAAENPARRARDLGDVEMLKEVREDGEKDE